MMIVEMEREEHSLADAYRPLEEQKIQQGTAAGVEGFRS